MQSYTEPARETPVTYDVDVLVAGGGVAGIAAATAAARQGVTVLLVERNGVLGGVATAGLMTSFGGMFYDALNDNVASGVPTEFVQRIAHRGGAPRHAVSPDPNLRPAKIVFDPEVFRLCAIEMLREAGAEILFHTLIADAITDGGVLKGVVIENKSGRQAVRAKAVVDCTGEMDVAARGGAPHTVIEGRGKVCHTLMHMIAGVKWQEMHDFLSEHRDEIVDTRFHELDWETFDDQWRRGYAYVGSWSIHHLSAWRPFEEIIRETIERGIFTEEHFNWGSVKGHDLGDGSVPEEGWCFDTQGLEGWPETDVADMMSTCTLEISGVDAHRISEFECFALQKTWERFEHIVRKLPGFADSRILSVAQDIGVRGARSVQTRGAFTKDDKQNGAVFPDVIGRGTAHTSATKYRRPDDANVDFLAGSDPRGPVRGFDIPYGLLLPVGVENLLIAGKAFGVIRSMPACMTTGQAAGMAAALAARRRVSPSELDVGELQETLRNNGVNLG